MATTNKKEELTLVGIGDEVIELTGADKEAFEADRKQMRESQALLEAEQAAKQEARTSALTKLATIAGLNEEEMTALGL
jgi:hypothetical protein